MFKSFKFQKNKKKEKKKRNRLSAELYNTKMFITTKGADYT